MPRTDRPDGRTPSPASTASRPLAGPTKQPPTRQSGGDPADSTQLVQSSSGMPGTQRCQASRTSTVAAAGNRNENTVSPGAGSVAKVNEVTMPKLPPPAPRSAQNSSGSRSADTVRSTPSAVT